MKSILLGLFAETSIHPGSGRSTGVIDLPVAREAATDYPVLVGSSLKGALKQWATEKALADAEIVQLFGAHENAGGMLVSDARLLLLPVRSLDSAYKWVTCPHLLERYQRDAKRAGSSAQFDLPNVSDGTALCAGSDLLILEERQFQRLSLPEDLCRGLAPLLPASSRDRLPSQLSILSDDDFVWFARYGLSIQARNQLQEQTKRSQNLWYEESLPADSLFYALLMDRFGTNRVESFAHALHQQPYIQCGGNETIGMGWFSLQLPTSEVVP